MKTLAAKTVVLTGASRGIGTHIAQALAKEQATVVCVARSPGGLEQTCAQVESLGAKAIALPFDLSQLDALPTLVKQIEERAGAVDILINNAAVEKFRAFEDYTLADIQAISTLNLLAPMELTRLLLPGMQERDRGHIVNISSGSGKKAAPYNSLYSASKAGLIMWSEALRQELANTGVGVSVICPGCTNAGMFLALDIPAPEGARVAEPTEVAAAAIAAIQENHKEVILDGLKIKVFYALSQLSPDFGDRMLQKAGVIETNRSCADKQKQKELKLKIKH